MTEVIGDIVYPNDFGLPQVTNTDANTMSGASHMLSGTMIYNLQLGKAEVYISGAGWETITSVAR